MNSSFKDHMLSEAELTWLKAVYEDSHFDPKTAKVRLRDKLPKGFDPKSIDTRFLLNGKILTILGIWKVDPESPVLKNLERVLLTIRDLVFAESGIETITSELLSTKLGLQDVDVQKALGLVTTLGGFYSGASGRAGSDGYSKIELTGDNGYDAYLTFESLESLMQEYYERHAQHSDVPETRLLSIPGTGDLSLAGPPTSYLYYPQSTVAPYQIKRNTAFVLMPMDRENPELEDVYETIKQVCDSFGVHAYRADEIQHQDRITDHILSEIKLCELLVADLSYERPNVYYEIGYAHALQKRPILYRKNGTRLHFDLSVHNVPEYRNITELRSLLHKRLEAILGRSATPPSL
jgi:hypothetical protein